MPATRRARARTGQGVGVAESMGPHSENRSQLPATLPISPITLCFVYNGIMIKRTSPSPTCGMPMPSGAGMRTSETELIMATVTLWLCTDCTEYAHGIDAHERGEDYPQAVIDAFADPVRDLGKPGLLTAGIMADEHECGRYDEESGVLYGHGECDCESIEFTWNRCDGCLSPLGGSRDAFTLWEG